MGVIAPTKSSPAAEAALTRALNDELADKGFVVAQLDKLRTESTLEPARADAARLASLPVTHVSAYALTLDPEVMAEEVPLARLLGQGRIALPSEEETLAQARALRGVLRRAGFRRYEISNFARPGHESVHNRLYWSAESYLGVGAGAFGCLHDGRGGAVRWGNLRQAGAWLEAVEAGRLPTAPGGEERLGPLDLSRERILLALRTREGLPEEEIPLARRGELGPLVRRRLVLRRGGRVVLTSRGMDLHGAVAERLTE